MDGGDGEEEPDGDETPDGEEPENDTDEEDEDAAEARIFAILDHPEAKGREKLARALARQGLSVKAAAKLLAAAPKANAALEKIKAGSPTPLKPSGGGNTKDDPVARIKTARSLLKRRRG